MEQIQRMWLQIESVLAERRGALVPVVVVILIVVSIAGYVFELEWTGLPGTTSGGPKTLWDWLDLLMVPLVLVAGALWFGKVEKDSRWAREQEEAKRAAFIEDQRAQEVALESYLDHMSVLLLEKEIPLLHSEPGSPAQDVASTLTLMVLRRLDKRRRNQVIHFLRDARLLGVKKSRASSEEAFTQETVADESDPIAVFALRNMRDINLSGANLSGANLGGAELSEANLSGAFLDGANLSGVRLFEANLSEAFLDGANLSGARLMVANLSGARLFVVNLSGANLGGARLRGANLSGANLFGANLGGADLTGANLSGANLSGANLGGAELSETNLSGAFLKEANLSRAILKGAMLRGANNLTVEQLKQANYWEQAYRDEELACGALIPTAPGEKAEDD